MREQLLGVGAGLGVGVCEPPARAEQLAQHGRHVPVALTRATLPLREGGAKLLHFVRHAQGYHNVDSGVMKTEEGHDARLTPEGRRQCATLQQLTSGLRPGK